MLNEYFDKVYVITCWGDTHRQESVRRQLKDNKIEFEFIVSTDKSLLKPGKNISPSEVSLLNSHLNCIKYAKLNNYSNIVIFEDDFLLLSDWKQRFKTFMENVPSDWSYLHLGIPLWTYDTYKPKGKKVNDHVQKVEFATCSHFIVLNKNIYDYAIQELSRFDLAADIMYEKKIYSKHKGYMPNHTLCDATSLPPQKFHNSIKNFNSKKFIKSNIRM